MKRSLIVATCLLAALPVDSAKADILYDSTGAPRYYNPVDANPLAFNVGFATDILWDDAPVFVNSVPNTYVDVTRLSFEILRVANAPAVDISVYWSNMVPDAGENRGGVTNDSPVNDPGVANLVNLSLVEPLGAIPLSQTNGPTATRLIYTIGNGVDPLFTTGVLDQSTADASTIDHGANFTYPVGTHPGYGYFFVGLQMSTEDPENMWVLASNPNNLFWVVDDFQDGDPSTIDEFFFGTDDPNELPIEDIKGTMSMKIEGVVVPEPTGLALLGVAGLGLLARRRKIA